MTAPLRVLVFSTLYPSSVRPGHGIFVETRTRSLLREPGVQVRVIAPVPWFPSTNLRLGERAAMARTAQRETQNGIDVLHPRYPLLPKIGMTLAPFGLAWAGLRAARQLRREGFDFDIIDAHYFYPDGVAAALLARWLGKPLVITARGSDLNLIAAYAVPRRMMAWAARHADRCVGVSRSLVRALEALGVSEGKACELRNGVDTERFHPIARDLAREHLGLRGDPLLLSVGNLLPVKRHEMTIEALGLLRAHCAGARLVIVGAGPQREALAKQAADLGLADAVMFAGARAQPELAAWYSAADLLVLASSREGWPNVLLEALACGTPVLASAVGGVAEVVSSSELGCIVELNDAAQLTEALLRTLATRRPRDILRRHAETMAWPAVSRAQRALFEEVLATRVSARHLSVGTPS